MVHHDQIGAGVEMRLLVGKFVWGLGDTAHITRIDGGVLEVGDSQHMIT